MGLMLFGTMVVGWILGLGITAVLGSVGIGFTIKAGKSRRGVWWGFAVVFVVILSLLVYGIRLIPFEQVRPGSDYDLAMKNGFLTGISYCACPGIAALLAGLASLLAPKKQE